MTRLRYWMAIATAAAIALNGFEARASLAAFAKDVDKEAPVAGQSPMLKAPTKKQPVSEASQPEATQAQIPALEEEAPVPPITPGDPIIEPNPQPRETRTLPNNPLPEVPIFPQPSDIVPIDPEADPPPYLDPHPNPLRFPTETEEVEVVGTQPITLNQAIELAVRNNLDLQEVRLSLQSSRASLREAQADWFPNLDLSSNLSWTDSANSRISIQRQEEIAGQRSILQTDSTSVTWNNELQLSYDVYTFGRRRGQIDSAEGEVRTSELEIERLLEDVRLQVTESYYDVQQADMDVLIARSAVENSQQSLEDAQALEEAGVGTQFDVLRAEVQLANDQQQLNQALSDQQITRRALSELLNLPQSVNVAAAEPVDLAGVWQLPLEDSIILALRNRAELEQQLVQREIAEARQQIARSQILPQFSVFGSVNLIDISDDSVGGLTEGYSAGAQMQWRLFDGGAAAAAVRQQELLQETAEVRFANLRNQVRLEVERAYYQLEARLQNVQRATTALTLAEESLELARLRFVAGVGTQTDVIQAQDDLTQAQGNLVDAILGYNRSLAQLRRAVSNYPFEDELQEAFQNISFGAES